MPLSAAQLRGISAGLTEEQVNHNWFWMSHAEAAEAGIDYEEYQELTPLQVRYGILKGLKRAQVIDLNVSQIEGVAAGLTREQVNHDWFVAYHRKAAEAGIDYEEYQELTWEQACYGILKGLTRAQVIGLNADQLFFAKKHNVPKASIIASATTTAEMLSDLRAYKAKINKCEASLFMLATKKQRDKLRKPAETTVTASATVGCSAGAGLPGSSKFFPAEEIAGRCATLDNLGKIEKSHVMSFLG